MHKYELSAKMAKKEERRKRGQKADGRRQKRAPLTLASFGQHSKAIKN